MQAAIVHVRTAGYNGVVSETGEAGPSAARLPWEDRHRIGLWRGYVDTLWPSLVQPQRFFALLAAPEEPSSLSDSLRFDLITHLIGASGVAIFYGAAVVAAPADVLAPMGIASIGVPARIAMVLAAFLASGPAGVVFDCGYALLVHGALRFIGETPAGLRGTVRAVMYGGGATALNCTLILTAFFIPQLWGTYCTMVALIHAQRVTRGQALTAVIVPSGVLILLSLMVIAVGLPMAIQKLAALGFVPSGLQP
jgi:hypothetical protein